MMDLQRKSKFDSEYNAESSLCPYKKIQAGFFRVPDRGLGVGGNGGKIERYQTDHPMEDAKWNSNHGADWRGGTSHIFRRKFNFLKAEFLKPRRKSAEGGGLFGDRSGKQRRMDFGPSVKDARNLKKQSALMLIENLQGLNDIKKVFIVNYLCEGIRVARRQEATLEHEANTIGDHNTSVNRKGTSVGTQKEPRFETTYNFPPLKPVFKSTMILSPSKSSQNFPNLIRPVKSRPSLKNLGMFTSPDKGSTTAKGQNLFSRGLTSVFTKSNNLNSKDFGPGYLESSHEIKVPAVKKHRNSSQTENSDNDWVNDDTK
jgi:hypothetical protein